MAEAGHNRFAATRYNVFEKLHVYPRKCTVMLTTVDSTVECTRERNACCEAHTTLIHHAYYELKCYSTPLHSTLMLLVISLFGIVATLGKEGDDPH